MSSRTIKLPLKPRETTRCWRLDGPDLPPITRTVTVAEAARAMLMRSFAQMFGQDRLPDGLHGPAHPDDPSHSHAYWLPEDRDGDGRIDHLTIHANAGFDACTSRVLVSAGPLLVAGAGRFRLMPVARDRIGHAPTCAWIAATPFIGPRHSYKRHPDRPRPSRSAMAQLAFELARLNDAQGRPLPGARIVPLDGPGLPPPDAFTLATRLPPDLTHPVRGWFAIEFAKPVSGPLAVGLAAHFGMGRFRPFWQGC